MIAETQAALSNVVSGSAGAIAGVGTAARAFTLGHPIGLAITGGIIVGIGAYYAANKYWLNKDEAK